MADVSTAEVVYAASGTGFTVDVTACNLVTDTTIKDFIVVLSDSSFADNTDYTKLSSTSIQYTGGVLAETIIFRRKTPATALREAAYAERVVSAEWNSEVDRLYRRLVEYEEFGTDYLAGSLGAGSGSVLDAAYGVVWNGDTSNAASRNALYDKIEPIATQQTTNTSDIATAQTDISNNTAAITDIQNGYAFTGSITAPDMNIDSGLLNADGAGNVSSNATSFTVTGQTLAEDDDSNEVMTTAYFADNFSRVDGTTRLDRSSTPAVTYPTNVNEFSSTPSALWWPESPSTYFGSLHMMNVQIAVYNNTGGAIADGTIMVQWPVGYRPEQYSFEFASTPGGLSSALVNATGGVAGYFAGGTLPNNDYWIFNSTWFTTNAPT